MTATENATITLPEYNGWTNKPTWIVNLWLTNDEATAYVLNEIANGSMHVHNAADRLKAWVEELVPSSGMASDLLSWSLAYVEWREIVESHREEEEEDQDEGESDLIACYLCRSDLDINDAFRIDGEWLCVDCANEHELEREAATGILA